MKSLTLSGADFKAPDSKYGLFLLTLARKIKIKLESKSRNRAV
jgi:hypothetical protein